MTSRELCAAGVPLLPLLAGIAVAALPSQRAGERVALVSAAPTRHPRFDHERLGARCQRPAAARRLAVRGRGRWRPRGRDRPGRSCQPGRVTRLSRDCSDDPVRRAEAARALLHRAARVLGCAAGRAAGGQPGRCLAVDRGHHRRVRAARRVLGQAARTRGSLEVPRPHVARPGPGTAGGPGAAARPACGRRDRSGSPGQASTPPRRGSTTSSRCSRTCSCWPDWLPRSAGRRFTTGFPMRTPRRRRRSRLCSRLRSCPPSCSSPGAFSRLSRLRSARRPHITSSSSSAWHRWPSRCPSSGARWPGSACWRTPASSTWA